MKGILNVKLCPQQLNFQTVLKKKQFFKELFENSEKRNSFFCTILLVNLFI